MAVSGACGGGGGKPHWPQVTGNGFAPTTGPGDENHYFPNAVGNEWTLNYTATETGSSEVRATLTATVLAPRTILGVSATVISQVDSGSGIGSFENYYGISPGGITYLGNSESEDTVTPHLVPFPEMLFPVQLGTLATIRAIRIPMGDDPFGNPLHLDMTQQIVNTQFVTLDLPAGSFSNVLQHVTTIDGTVDDDELGISIPFTGSETRWFAPDVGLVKQSSTATVDTMTTTSTAELRGYMVDGVRHGVGLVKTVLDGLSPGDNFVGPPMGNPVVASDGTNYLVVGRKVTGGPGSYMSNWVAQRVGPDGTLLGGSFDLGPPTEVSDPSAGENAALAFDGINYIVVHEQDEQFMHTGLMSSLVAVRVSPQGTLVGNINTVVPATVANPSASEPALSFDGTRCLVCFIRGWDGGALTGVFVSPSTGQADGAEFPIIAPGTHYTPALAFNGENYLAVWAQASSGVQTPGVFATRIDVAGNVLDAGGIALSNISSQRPAVASDGNNFLVLWSDLRLGTEDIYANRISPSGQRLDGDAATGGTALTTSPGRAEVSPTVVFFDGNYMAAWMSSPAIGVYDGLYGARISTSGALSSPGAAGIPLTNPGFQGHPLLAATSGSALLTWFENRSVTIAPNAVGAVSIFPFGP